MSVKISVKYPEASESTPDTDLSILKSVEEIIKDNGVRIFCSTSNYTWRLSKSYDWDSFYILEKDYDNTQIIEIGIREIRRIGPEKFKDRLIERSHQDSQ